VPGGEPGPLLGSSSVDDRLLSSGPLRATELSGLGAQSQPEALFPLHPKTLEAQCRRLQMGSWHQIREEDASHQGTPLGPGSSGSPVGGAPEEVPLRGPAERPGAAHGGGGPAGDGCVGGSRRTQQRQRGRPPGGSGGARGLQGTAAGAVRQVGGGGAAGLPATGPVVRHPRASRPMLELCARCNFLHAYSVQ